MSLFVEDEGRGGRSRSRSRDRRPKDEPPTERPGFDDIREPSYVYPEDDLEERFNSSRRSGKPPKGGGGGGLPYPADADINQMLPGAPALYSTTHDAHPAIYRTASPPADSPYRNSRDKVQEQLPGSFPGEDDDSGKAARVRYTEPRDGDKRDRRGRDEDADDASRGPRVRYAEPKDLEKDSKRDRRGRDEEDERRVRYSDPPRKRRDDPEDERSNRYSEPPKSKRDDPPALDDDRLKFLPQKYSNKYDDAASNGNGKSRSSRHDGPPSPADERLKSLPSKYSSKYANDDDAVSGRDPRSSRDSFGKEKDRLDDDRLKFLPQKYSSKYDDEDGRPSDRDEKSERRRKKKERDQEDLAYGKPPPSPGPETPKTYGSYIPGGQRGDDRRSSKLSLREDDPERRRPVSPTIDEYGSKPSKRDSHRDSRRDDPRDDPRDSRRDSRRDDPRDDPRGDPRDSRRDSRRDDPRDDPRSSRSNILTVDPETRGRDRSRDRRGDKPPKPEGLTVDTGANGRERSRDRRGSGRGTSPQPPVSRMSSLTVGGAAGAVAGASALSLSAAPGSPLLESYHGTYQDMSPMPSPLLLASGSSLGGLEPISPSSPLASDTEGSDGRKRSRRARFHDPEESSTRLAKALQGEGPPDLEPLIEILPSLTHDQVMELRKEYKELVKTGSKRRGVNIAKHIRARLKDEDPNFMKACYSIALGKWESEGYWANFWYQGDKTRRELLIESLMGRTNEEIREIKESFQDKKYDDSLTKCMKMELKEDKFKKAVLMVLEERRMEEFDRHGRKLPIDYKLVDEDVDDLHKAVKSDKGGESKMISIVVQRSDSHLRAILKEYEHAYRSNFARDSLRKSGNLVVST
jgi:hypothetical protein